MRHSGTNSTLKNKDYSLTFSIIAKWQFVTITLLFLWCITSVLLIIRTGMFRSNNSFYIHTIFYICSIILNLVVVWYIEQFNFLSSPLDVKRLLSRIRSSDTRLSNNLDQNNNDILTAESQISSNSPEFPSSIHSRIRMQYTSTHENTRSEQRRIYCTMYFLLLCVFVDSWLFYYLHPLLLTIASVILIIRIYMIEKLNVLGYKYEKHLWFVSAKYIRKSWSLLMCEIKQIHFVYKAKIHVLSLLFKMCLLTWFVLGSGSSALSSSVQKAVVDSNREIEITALANLTNRSVQYATMMDNYFANVVHGIHNLSKGAIQHVDTKTGLNKYNTTSLLGPRGWFILIPTLPESRSTSESVLRIPGMNMWKLLFPFPLTLDNSMKSLRSGASSKLRSANLDIIKSNLLGVSSHASNITEPDINDFSLFHSLELLLQQNRSEEYWRSSNCLHCKYNNASLTLDLFSFNLTQQLFQDLDSIKFAGMGGSSSSTNHFVQYCSYLQWMQLLDWVLIIPLSNPVRTSKPFSIPVFGSHPQDDILGHVFKFLRFIPRKLSLDPDASSSQTEVKLASDSTTLYLWNLNPQYIDSHCFYVNQSLARSENGTVHKQELFVKADKGIPLVYLQSLLNFKATNMIHDISSTLLDISSEKDLRYCQQFAECILSEKDFVVWTNKIILRSMILRHFLRVSTLSRWTVYTNHSIMFDILRHKAQGFYHSNSTTQARALSNEFLETK